MLAVLPWVISLLTILSVVLVGQKRPSGWGLSLFCQVLWLWFLVTTTSWGLLPLTVCMTLLSLYNYHQWKQGVPPVAKMKLEHFVTPTGRALWPRLNSPDTTYKAEGEYSVKLVLSEAEAQPVIEQISATWKDYYKNTCATESKKKLKKANAPWKPNTDAEGNEIPGELVFKFGMKANIKTKSGVEFSQKPALFDAKGKPTDSQLGNDSRIKVSAEIYPWYTAALGCGVSLRLRAVQIIELVEYNGGRTASGFGFGEEEGFVDTAAGASDFDEAETDSAPDDDPEADF